MSVGRTANLSCSPLTQCFSFCVGEHSALIMAVTLRIHRDFLNMLAKPSKVCNVEHIVCVALQEVST